MLEVDLQGGKTKVSKQAQARPGGWEALEGAPGHARVRSESGDYSNIVSNTRQAKRSLCRR